MKLPLADVQPYIDSGLVTRRAHNSEKLWILNYTPKCQYERKFDHVTERCRGLVVNEDDEIVGYCMPKFRNYEEHTPGTLPNEPFEVFEKLDGSMLISAIIPGTRRLFAATRGSFHSTQAEEAKQIIREHFWNYDPRFTYIYEAILENNRIVVDYGDTQTLVLLTAFHTETGEEVPYEYLEGLTPFSVVQKYEGFTNAEQLLKMNEINREGFVLRYKSGLRVKVKWDWYNERAKILMHLSTTTIWEALSEGIFDADIYSCLPPEFRDWVDAQVAKQRLAYAEIETAALQVYNRVKSIVPRSSAAQALNGNDLSHIVWKMYDKRDYSMLIYKRIKPVYAKPFRIEE